MQEEAGGGGAVTRTNEVNGENGIAGGKGGNGSAYASSGGLTWYASGGVGIQDGNIQSASSSGVKNQIITIDESNIESCGSGGLLIIYANNIVNNSKIASNGSIGVNKTAVDSPGGSSGGGSINIFYGNNCENNGEITAVGGEAVQTNIKSAKRKGGKGGDGTVTIGRIPEGTFVKE